MIQMQNSRRLQSLLDSFLLVAAVLILWQLTFYSVGDVAITAPLPTIERAVELVGDPRFAGHLEATGSAFLYSLAISSTFGIVLGVLFGLHRFSGEVAEPIFTSLYTIPKVTLYPLILLIFGLGISAKVAFGIIHGIIPVVLFTMDAIKHIKPIYRKMAVSMRLTPSQTAMHILVPAVAPEIFTGLRVGFSLTLLGVLVGEMFASQRGLGFLIVNGIQRHDVGVVTVVVMLIIMFAVLSSLILLRIEKILYRNE